MVRVGRARASELAAIEGLLGAAGLPLDGARAAFEDGVGVVARDGGTVLAAAAIERFGAAGLLRSVVVAPGRRSEGLGRRVVAAAERAARQEGLGTLYLLTESAAGWFPRLGYVPIPRDAAAAAVGASVEFTTTCATSAVAMRRELA